MAPGRLIIQPNDAQAFVNTKEQGKQAEGRKERGRPLLDHTVIVGLRE